MSAILTLRDALFGNPPVGGFKPSREGVLKAFEEVVQIISAVVGGVIPVNPTAIYASRDTLYNHLEFVDRSLGLVYADSDAERIGIYIKNGAANDGNWIYTGLLGRGPRGYGATVSIGNVVSGLSPSVTNTGNQTDAILDFVLQKGVDGKSLLQTAIDAGYAPSGTTESQLIQIIVGQISSEARGYATQAQGFYLTAQQQAEIATVQAVISRVAADDSGGYLTAIRQLLGNTTPVGQLPLEATSYAQMAGFAVNALTSGRQVYCSEPKREGLFRWLTGDRSVIVTSDPYQGLYVAPTSDVTGASGCWGRIPILPGLPGGGEYALDWWNPTRFNGTTDAGQLVLNTINALLSPGDTLRWGANIVHVKSGGGSSANTLFTKPINVVGSGRKISRLELIRRTDGQSQLNTDGLLKWRCAGSITVQNIGFSGEIINQNSNDAACLDFQSIDNNSDAMDGIEVKGCGFEYTATPVLTRSGGNSPGSPGQEGNFNVIRNVVVSDCFMSTVKYGALFFTADNVTFRNNFVRPHPNSSEFPAAHGWRSGVRVCGLHGFKMHDNYVEMPDLTSGIPSAMVKFDDANLGTGYQRTNRDLHVYDNRQVGGNYMYEIHNYDYAVCRNNTWSNAPTNTLRRQVILVNGANDQNNLFKMGTMDVMGDTYIGVSGLYSCDAGQDLNKMGILTVSDSSLVGNRFSGNYPDNALVKSTYPGMKYIALKRVSVIMSPRASYEFQMRFPADTTLIVEDCTFPEFGGGGLIETPGGSINTGQPDSLQAIFTVGSTSYDPVANTYRRQPAGLFNKLYPA